MGSGCLGWGQSCYSLFTWQPSLGEKYFLLAFNSPQLNFRHRQACKEQILLKFFQWNSTRCVLWQSYARYFTGRYSLMNFCYLQKAFLHSSTHHLLSLSLGPCIFVSHAVCGSLSWPQDFRCVCVCVLHWMCVCIDGSARSRQRAKKRQELRSEISGNVRNFCPHSFAVEWASWPECLLSGSGEQWEQSGRNT